MRYRFAFLAETQESVSSGGRHWFKVERILDAPSTDDLEDLIEQEQKRLPDGVTSEQVRAFNRNLRRLHEAVWKDDVIWYHTEHE